MNTSKPIVECCSESELFLGRDKSNQKVKMPSGTYWVGDLCYVLDEEWDEFCDITSVGNGDCYDGKIVLPSGRIAVSFGTAYGDGYYLDNKGRGYPVDAGLLGAIKFEDLKNSSKNNDGGHVIEFENDFYCYYENENGVIHFGDVSIDTEGSDEDYDDDEEDDED